MTRYVTDDIKSYSDNSDKVQTTAKYRNNVIF